MTRQIVRTEKAPKAPAYFSQAVATFIQAEESDFPRVNEEWIKWFPHDPPARQSAQLPVRPQNKKISIAVIAES